MGKGSKAPSPPNPYQTAAAQTASNKETAITQAGLNMVNQVTPDGSLTYSQNGSWSDGTPRYTATQVLSPNQQQLKTIGDQTNLSLAQTGQSQAAKLGGILGTPVDFSSAPELRSKIGANDFSADRQRVEQALFDRLAPQMDRRRSQLEDQLRNQGLQAGSEGWNTRMDDLSRENNDLRLATVAQAGQEQNRLSGLEQGQASFQNNARTQAIAETLQQRNQPINETAALMGGTQVAGPNLFSTPQTGVGGTDVGGYINSAYQGQLANYNAGQQRNNAAMGGIFGIGSSIASALPWGTMFSDRRLKEGASIIGRLRNGLAVYTYRYRGGKTHHIGVMADEVARIIPAAIRRVGAFFAVDYSEVRAWA